VAIADDGEIESEVVHGAHGGFGEPKSLIHVDQDPQELCGDDSSFVARR
jgi:hypothetical protein